MTPPAVALDVGGATLKATRVIPSSSTHGHKQGRHVLSSSSSAEYAAAGVVTLANQIATVGAAGQGTTLLGKELLDKERQRAKLHYVRPVERGYCVNWNIETELWTHLFSNKMLNVTPSDHTLVATAPLFAPSVLSETMDEVVFEEFGFAAHSRVSSAEMCVLSYSDYCRREATKTAEPSPKRPRGAKSKQPNPVVDTVGTQAEEEEDWRAFHKSSCQLVVDSGFSFTHVTPVIDGRVYSAGVKRISVGGKLLTNYLKEIVSYRQWNVMDESMVINELKEALCYCSLDFQNEMTTYHRDRSSRKHWILPDFVRSFSGRLRAEPSTATRGGDDDDDEQALEMGVEMITVPEVLFHPSDIGIDQAGLAEAIMQSVEACPVDVRATLLENILLVGGNSKFRHFRERLERELRPLAPQEYEIRILQPDDPITSAVDGCAQFAKSDQLKARVVTKQEYEEHGSSICFRRFR